MDILAPITVIDCLNPPFTILVFNSSALKLSLNGPLMPPKNRGNVQGRSTGPGHPLNHQSFFPIQMLAFPLMSYTIVLFHALFLSFCDFLVKDH